MRSIRSVSKLTAIILAPAPRRTAARDRAAMRQTSGDVREAQIAADNRRRGHASRRAITELTMIVSAPAERAAVDRDETTVHAAGDDA
jgi:hypothetical protein